MLYCTDSYLTGRDGCSFHPCSSPNGNSYFVIEFYCPHTGEYVWADYTCTCYVA